MSEDDRFRRPDPERTGPIRQWEGARRSAHAWQRDDGAPPPHDADPWAASSAPHTPHENDTTTTPWGRPASPPLNADSTPGSPPPWQDSVTQSVELGYRVVEEQIRMGQEMARRLGVTHPTGLGYGNEDPWNMLRRALRYSEDMAGLIFQFVGALASRPGAMNDFMRSPMSGNPPPGNPFATGAEPSQEAAWGNPWQSQDPHRPTTTEPWGHGAPPSASGFANPFAHPSAESTAASAPRRSIMIEVRSERPTQLRLELSPEAGNRPLVCHPLHATEGDHRLTDIVADPGDEPCWVLTVSNQQPAGLYRGSITDREWGTPYGCISLRVGSSNAENSGFPRAVTADPSSD